MEFILREDGEHTNSIWTIKLFMILKMRCTTARFKILEFTTKGVKLMQFPGLIVRKCFLPLVLIAIFSAKEDNT